VNQEKSTQLHSPTRHFSVLLSPTPRGARLARLLATEWLRTWDLPHGVTETAEHLVAELAANAATHGRLPGRDFRLALHTTTDVLRIEVTDTRGDDLPHCQPPSTEAVSGRGLLLVEALADRWGVERGPVPRKTVWAELRLQKPEHDEPCSGATGGLF
jgi:anti-sigma regulatory factor (Ser/Thr protein kinase)